jgi:hypothetical protein
MMLLSRNLIFTFCLSPLLLACSGEVSAEKMTKDDTLSPQQAFLVNLKALCGQSFTGAVVSDDPQDADWRSEVLTVGPISCTDSASVMPLAVGQDKSRLWTVSLADNDRVKLSHAHTLKDGSPDPVTGYGGVAANAGTAARQEFPVDEYSVNLFLENGLEASVTNIWSLEIVPEKTLAYELNREGRHFRAVFDISSGGSAN